MPSEHLLEEVFGHVLLGGSLVVASSLDEEITSLGWLGNAVSVSPKEMDEVAWVWKILGSLFGLLSLQCGPDKKRKDGCMDRWISISHSFDSSFVCYLSNKISFTWYSLNVGQCQSFTVQSFKLRSVICSCHHINVRHWRHILSYNKQPRGNLKLTDKS